MPRYVILQHDAPRGLHWDLLLETAGLLSAWAISRPPDEPGEIPAERLPDHRRLYLEYEGPISGDRGTVTRWDAGEYRIQRRREGLLEFHVFGQRRRGVVRLTRSQSAPEKWSFRYFPEPAAGWPGA
ncbi:MAG: hypothetical protein GYA33_07360 [Thermogutta sp.]|nr:hypothetical protein [Thermogutta sp.]